MNFNKFQQVSISFKILIFFSCAFSFLFFIFDFSQAAVLYLEPEKAQYYPGDTFIEEVRLDVAEGENINAVEVHLIYPPDILEVVDLSVGNSILTLIAQQPNFSNGLVSFSGGIPGGYSGTISGDLGTTNLLGKIIFRAIKEGKAKIRFADDSIVLLNDGLGTPTKLTTKGASFIILAEKTGIVEEPWQIELKKDTIPPEPFKIEVRQESLIFEGKYVLIFSTTDKQTGLDYYEVKEGTGDWKKSESPYLLEDQNLRGVIKVKAVDKAGNERIAEYQPPKKSFFYQIINLIKSIWNWIIKIIH